MSVKVYRLTIDALSRVFPNLSEAEIRELLRLNQVVLTGGGVVVMARKGSPVYFAWLGLVKRGLVRRPRR